MPHNSPMASLRQHRLRWRATVRIPTHLVHHYGGKRFLSRHLATSDRREAALLADAWETGLRIEWAQMSGKTETSRAALRELYASLRGEAERGEFQLIGSPEADPVLEGVDREIEKLADATEGRELAPVEAVRLAALQDASAALQNRKVPRRRELEPSFSELASEYVALWATQSGLKESNTRQQKEATFRLFGESIEDRPIREVAQADAAAFIDALRQMDPLWARSPKARELSWSALQAQYGGRARGMSDATVNRHAQALKALWEWAAKRGHCEGHNPFEGHRRRLRVGVNVHGYLPWETKELNALLNPPPRRADLTELILAGMFTGMRLNELASLRWEQVREAEGVRFIQVEDAKTPAGNRQVPLHPALGWLWDRRGQPQERVWPAFNPEGPGKKPGADAGRDFSRFKTGKGFADRRKVFHSFRKNVTQIMERAGVSENEWAQVFGHERGFTYGRYSPHGITLKRKAEIISLISYPGVTFTKLKQPAAA